MKRENPAKVFLRQYRGAVARVNALQRAIDQAMERAFNISVTLKEVRVVSSPAESDPMAANVCTAADASEILYQEKGKVDALLRDILAAIDSVTDERQKAVLTMRYVNGESFLNIAEAMFLSEPAVYIAHGRALVAVNKWLEVQKDASIRKTAG